MNTSKLAFAGRAFLESDLSGADWSFPEGAALQQRLGSPQELEVEYVRLFLNPAGAPCSPWQSAHEDEGRLMGLAHQSAQTWYSKYGVAPRIDSEPADHIGLLLTFYAQLLAADAPAEDLLNFAARHLAWIPAFAEQVAREARHPFYSALGAFTAETVRDELSTRQRPN